MDLDLNLILVVSVIVIALAFDYTNGFHDAANAIATSVSTRALTPRRALIMAALMNIIGALLGTDVAKTIGKGIIGIEQYSDPLKFDPTLNAADVMAMQREGLIIVLGALIGAVVWNLITWWFGLPSSSSHALIGGLVGAGLAAQTTVEWWGIFTHVVIPMFGSPILGFFLGFILMKILLRAVANLPYHRTMRRFRFLQTLSAALMALGHGLQDAQKTMALSSWLCLQAATANITRSSLPYLMAPLISPSHCGSSLQQQSLSLLAPTQAAGESCAPWDARSLIWIPPEVSLQSP